MAVGLCLAVSGCVGPLFGRVPRGQPDEVVMTVTGYCPCGECCGWRRTWLGRPVYSGGALRGERKAVGITASGTRARGGTVAADASRFDFGTVVYVEGYGYGRVEDRGSGIVGAHIDLFFRTHAEAERWGVRRMRVLVWPATGR